MGKMRVTPILIVAALLGPLVASAANITWTNGTGNGLWSTPGNWGTGTVPGAADVAVFTGTSSANCLMDVPVTVAGVSIQTAYSGVITQQAGRTISVGAQGWMQAAGTFVGGNANIQLTAGTFNLGGGHFISTMASLILSGNYALDAQVFSHTGGDFDAQNGTVQIMPNYNSWMASTFVVDVAPSTWFNDLVVGASGNYDNASLNTAPDDTLRAHNSFTHVDGRINGIIRVDGDVRVMATADGGQGQLIFAGTGDQEYNTLAAGRSFVWVIEKPSGQVLPYTSTVDLSIQGFRQIKGDFIAPAGQMRVGGTWSAGTLLFQHAGGNFDHNHGSVILDPYYNSWMAQTFNVEVMPATWLYDLAIGAAGNSDNITLAVTAGDTLKAANGFTHLDGTLNGQYLVLGNLTVGSGADGGRGELHLTALGDQYYSSPAATGRTMVLVVHKPGGAVLPAIGTGRFAIQGFRQLAGDFTAPADTLFIGGTWNDNATILQQTGGNFAHNNGTVVFDPYYGSYQVRTFTIDPLPTLWLNKVVMKVSSSSDNAIITTAASDTLKALGDFTHADGKIMGNFLMRGDLFLGTQADGGEGQLIMDAATDQFYHAALPVARTAVLVLDKSSGAVLPAPGTSQLRIQGFRQIAGAFTAPSDTLFIGGTWSDNATLFQQTAGTFAHSNGTVAFDPYYGSYQVRTFTIAPLPALWLNHVMVKVSSSSDNAIITTAASDTLKALGNLTHADGKIMGNFLMRGDLFLRSKADGGEGQLIMDAATDQRYHTQLPAARTAVLVVAKPSGAVLPAPGTSQLSIQGFRQSAGAFTAPSDTLFIGGTWSDNATLIRQTGGTFAHNSGTVKLDPYFATYQAKTFTVEPLPTLWLNDVMVKVSSSSDNAVITTAASDTLKALRNFTHADGKIMGNFLLRGDLFLRSKADGGEGHLIMDAATDQRYHTQLPTARTAVLVVAKPSGNVLPAPGTGVLSIQGFRETAGHFIAPVDTLYIGGTWSDNATLIQHTGGTFAHNSGTVKLDPYFATFQPKTFTVEPLPSLWLNDVVVKVSSSSDNAVITTAASDTLKALGNLTHADGKIMGNFLMRGDLFLRSKADGGEGHLIMDAATDQYYHVEQPAARTAVLVVAKPAGNVLPATGTTRFHIQGFRQTAGHFLAPVDTLFIGGRWSDNATILQCTGGNFAHNNGTVMLDPYFGTYQVKTFTVAPMPTLWLNKVVLRAWSSSDNATLLCAAGDTLKALGDLTHADGKIMGNFLTRGDLFLKNKADGGEGLLIMNAATDQYYHVELPAARTGVLVVDKPAGAVLPAPGTDLLRIQGFRQFAGDFTAPADVMSIGGTWSDNTILVSHQNGAFNHANGQVILEPNPGCVSRTFTLDVSPQIKFNHLLLSMASTCGTSTFLVPAAGALVSEGHFELARGRFNGGTAIAEGPVTVYPAFQSGTGSLVFEGTNDQLFNLTGAEAKFDGNITLNKTAGNVELLSALTMDLASTQLSLQGGRLITTAANLLTIARNVTATPGHDNSFVDGPMRKIGNNAFVFPIGKDSRYAPIAISAPAATASVFTAEYHWEDPEDAGYSVNNLAAGLHHLSRCEYWELDRTGSTSNVTVSLHWGSHSCGVTEPTDLRVAGWNGALWENRGNGGNTALPGGGMVQSAGAVSLFGPFTLASASFFNPLPVELLSFTAVAEGDHVALEWATASEKNSSHYIVERSKDAITFEEVLRTPAAGNSSYLLRYADIDHKPLSGISYYRLKQVDIDGTTETFNIVPVRFDGMNVTVYPNPTDGTRLWVSLEATDGAVIIELIDPLGRTVINRQAEPGGASQAIDLGQSNLAKGTYQVRLTQNGTVVTKAVVVM